MSVYTRGATLSLYQETSSFCYFKGLELSLQFKRVMIVFSINRGHWSFHLLMTVFSCWSVCLSVGMSVILSAIGSV